MSNELYPVLPGKRFGTRRRQMHATTVKTSTSGREYRAANWVYPKWRYVLQYEFLRSGSEAEFQALIDFFDRRRGRLDSFLFDDEDDNTCSLQTIAIANGATTVFRLVRSLVPGGFLVAVSRLNGTPSIYVNGALQSSGYTATADGVLTFTSPPANGAVIAWSGAYHWRVRFDKDELELEKFLRQLWSAGSVDLITTPY
jgi:uncharacterized protein (TIGR02217 family)